MELVPLFCCGGHFPKANLACQSLIRRGRKIMGIFSGISAYAVMRTEILKIQNFIIAEKSVLLGD
jgi:hypothetical protein